MSDTIIVGRQAGLNKAIAGIPMPTRMRSRPISAKGFPVPWFVTHKDEAGEWDFRVVDPRRILEAHRNKKCWLCGEPLGRFLAFSIGPMCAINRISSEPPSHRECAEYAVRACPFLSRPRAKRNEADLPEGAGGGAGIMLARNPGVILIWITRDYALVQDGKKGVLFKVGEPVGSYWFSEGRPAVRAEVDASVKSGLPFLEDIAKKEGGAAVAVLAKQIMAAEPIFATATP